MNAVFTGPVPDPCRPRVIVFFRQRNAVRYVAEKLLDSAGLLSRFEMLLSVDAVGEWKPAVHAHEHALAQCDVDDPCEAMLVAVHPWDIDAASRAGLATAWLNRDGGAYPGYFRARKWKWPPSCGWPSVSEATSHLDGPGRTMGA